METIISNAVGKARQAKLNGRDYLVVPFTSIVPGVMNGSKGPLYYPPEEVAAEPGMWNGMPLVMYHPVVNGQNVSARSPDVLDTYLCGYVFNDHVNKVGKRRGEAWFDVELTEKRDARLPTEHKILTKLRTGKQVELSTGLFTKNEPVANGEQAVHNGKQYSFVARRYRADHLAVLPDEVGACSLQDGCGFHVTNSASTECVLNAEGICSNCGGEGGKPGPCSAGGAKPIKSSELGGHAWGMSQKANTDNTKEAHEAAAKAHMAAMIHYGGLRSTPGNVGKANGHARQAGVHKKAAEALTTNTGADTQCTLNSEGVCTNCGGKGGKPGPCPTGGVPAPRKKQLGFDLVPGVKSIRKAPDHHLTGNKIVTLEDGKEHPIFFDAASGAYWHGNHVTDNDRMRGYLGQKSDVLTRLVQGAAEGKLTANEMSLPKGDDTEPMMRKKRKRRKAADVMKGCIYNAEGICVNCGGKGGKPGPCKTKAELASIKAANDFETSWESHAKAAKAHMAAKKAFTAAAEASTDEAEKRAHTSAAAYHYAKAHGHFGKAGMDTRLADNSQGDTDVDKATLITHLTTNCDCWKGAGDKAILEQMSVEKLRQLKASDDATKVLVGNSKQLTFKELLERASPEERAPFDYAMSIERRERETVVNRLVANVKDDALKARLVAIHMSKPLQQLHDELLALPAPVVNQSGDRLHGMDVPNYPLFSGAGVGQQGVTVNRESLKAGVEDDALPLPSTRDVVTNKQAS